MYGSGGPGKHDARTLVWFLRALGLNNKDDMTPAQEAAYQVALNSHMQMRERIKDQERRRAEHLGAEVAAEGPAPPPSEGAATVG
jgi:hypothetical protein